MKPLTFPLLRRLADGRFRSGEALARELGCSRAAVWAALQEADALGLDLDRVRGRGYRLTHPIQWLDAGRVAALLGDEARRFDIRVFEVVESTSALLGADGDAPAGRVVAAEWQSRGRGRRGRSWHGGVGGGLTFSLRWEFAGGVGALAGLSLAVGVALVRALKRFGVVAQLKWPNDLLWRGRKLAGILIEVQGDMLGPSVAVIGVGLNLRLPASVLARIDQPAIDLAAAGASPDRNELLAAILAETAAVLDDFGRHGFVPLADEWQRHHAHQNRTVRLALSDSMSETGEALGVDERGALLLATENGVRRCHSGEIAR